MKKYLKLLLISLIITVLIIISLGSIKVKEIILIFVVCLTILILIDLLFNKVSKLCIPRQYVKDILNIDYQKLKKNGYKILIFDLDNTIGNVKEKVCSKEIVDMLNKLNKDFIVIVASNSRKKRVESFCEKLECSRMHFSFKPFGIILKRIKKEYNIDYSKMVIIGDQLMTDMFLGNRYKLLTILVDKKSEYDLYVTKFNRIFENIIKKKYNMKEGEYYK